MRCVCNDCGQEFMTDISLEKHHINNCPAKLQPHIKRLEEKLANVSGLKSKTGDTIMTTTQLIELHDDFRDGLIMWVESKHYHRLCECVCELCSGGDCPKCEFKPLPKGTLKTGGGE